MSAQPEGRPVVESPFLTYEEAAVYTRTSRATLERAVRSGALQYCSPNRGSVKALKFFTREQLDAWMTAPASARLRPAPEPVPVDPRSRQRRRTS
jgi:excisionase family DNA binding protein